MDEVTELNVKQVVQKIRDQSPILKAMEDEGKIRIVSSSIRRYSRNLYF